MTQCVGDGYTGRPVAKISQRGSFSSRPTPARPPYPAWTDWAGFAAGLAWFLLNGGAHALVPTHVDWVAQNDWSQHYLGWAYFRISPWSWPIGRTPGLATPLGCNLAYADSAPLVSVVLRPLLFWTSRPVQFIGPFIATALGLQGLFAVRLARRLGGTWAAQLGFAALLVSCPLLLHRIDHDTLTSHWLLLATFLSALAPLDAQASGRRYALAAAGIALLAAGTHPYQLAMVWPMLLGATVLHAWRGTLSRGAAGATLAALGPGVFGATYALGYLDDGGSNGSDGYNFFAANFIGWLNPQGWSRLLPDQPVLPGQTFEGFCYLGLGGLFLLAAGLAVRVWRRRAFGGDAATPGGVALAPYAGPHAEVRRVFLLLFFLAGAMALFAVTNAAHLRLTNVWNLPAYSVWLGPLTRIFRSSGRFAWPLTYLVLVWAAACVVRGLSPRAAAVVLSFAGALQLVDVRPQQVAERFNAPGLAQLHDLRWELVGADFDELTLVPFNVPNSYVRCGKVRYPNKYELALGFFAVRHNMRINSAYTARVNDGRVAELCVEQLNALQQGQLTDPRHLYVVAPNYLDYFQRAGSGMRCAVLDGYHVCAASSSKAFAAALR